MLTHGDKPSGKNKKEVVAAIAKHIFGQNPEHSSTYTIDLEKYTTSVTNRLSAQKRTYREHCARFTSTGGGIFPQVCRVFPYYDDLNSIWKDISSFNSKLVLSKAGVDHTKSLLQIVKAKSLAGTEHDKDSMQDDGDAEEVNGGPAVRDAEQHDGGDVPMDDELEEGSKHECKAAVKD
ncbi:hypothetical protein EV363DRAFT_1400563 [Boletus edulis]|nr:hypothetical protein EV363DRAFT_1400563 [Boletus edulis]